MTKKHCPRCEQDKSTCDFYKSRNHSDGLQSWCTVCTQEYLRNYRQCEENKQRQLEAHRRHRKCAKYAKTHKQAAKKQCLRHPDRIKARQAVNNIVDTGKLAPAKTSECVHCGEQAAYWHHWAGYAKEHWLDVIPLCSNCDRKAHKVA